MIIVKYGLNPQGIKEVEIQPQLVDSLIKKNNKNKKRPEPKKNNSKQKEETPSCSHTTQKGQKGVETKRQSSEVHLHTTQVEQNGVGTEEGVIIRVYSFGH
jgi:hypothetical protein